MKKRIWILTFFVSTIILSQENEIDSNLYSSFDKVLTQLNTNLSYGTIFREKYRKKKNSHNFLISDKFKKGDVILDETPYFNIDMKYDLTEDILILCIINDEQKISIIPEKEKITSFKLNNLKFINTKDYGFVQEKTTENKFSIYIKHTKKVIENKDRNYLYYTFKKKTENLIYFNNKFHSITSKKDIINIFPKNKKKINEFYKKNKFSLKNNYDIFIVKILNKLLN